ncbi:MAG TPA: hypothetical protein DEP91_11520 [Sphingomonas bacterium]|jgi:hypothetical protein|uniref:Uncharacterized protein n=1 Tax=Sphingomonas bacterium TaxID=1895847 RepID=A0A3D0WE07_9SPHN|nr:hypothetical protein [Sphingomonas bacterium]
MGIEITCDKCSKDCDVETYCGTCYDLAQSDCNCDEASVEAPDVGFDVTSAAAIRRGDVSEAEHLLDKVAGQIDGWSDMVSIGRYSPRSRGA